MPETLHEPESVGTAIQTALRHTAVYGLGNVFAKALGFLMVPFYTHFLNPVDYGTLEILDLSMSLFGMFLNMGITAALLRSYALSQSAAERQRAVSTVFLFVIITGSITFLLGLRLVQPASTLLLGPHIPATYLLLSLGALILNYIGGLPRTYLRALEASGTLTIVDTLSISVMLALNIYFIAILKTGLLGILLSSVIVGGLQAIILSAWALHRVGIRFSGSQLRQMTRFGLPLIFSNLSIFALNFSDRFFLQHFRSLDVVGIYAVGYKFGFMMNYLLVQPFYVMWQARMYLVHAQPNHAKIFGQIFVFYSLLLTCAGFILSVLSPELVQAMVGAKFAASRDVIPIVALAYVFYGIGYYVQLGMFLTGQTKLIGMISAVAACINVGLNYYLIRHYGMLGAAWATLFSFAAISVGSYWASQRVFPLSLAVGRIAMAIGLAVSLYLLSRWWTSGVLAIALVEKAFLLAAFPFLLWKTHILSPAEIRTLTSTKDKTLKGALRLVGLCAEDGNP